MISRARNRLLFLVFLAVAVLLGLKPLVDADIGWHLATGLWMLQHGTVPRVDPFGSQGGEFIAYSWLAELLFAVVFRAAGFSGLQVLQLLLIAASFAAVFALLQNCQGGRASDWPSVLGLAAVLLLIVPSWHLRPQLLSVIIFAVMLRLLLKERPALLTLFGLTLLWAQLHLFWVFAPLAFFLIQARRSFVRAALFSPVLLCCGLLTPYGLDTYRVLFRYTFEHAAGYALVTEFQPLGFQHGYVLPVLLALALVAALTHRRLVEEGRGGALVLFAIFLGLALLRLKYLPFAALAAVPLLPLRGREEEQSGSAAAVLAAALLVAVPAAAMLCGMSRPLAASRLELLQLTRQLSERRLRVSASELPVLNHFNDAGWLILGFWLARREAEPRYRVLVDGRTLVAGEKRLREFDRLRRGAALCPIIEGWERPRVIILAASSALTRRLAAAWPECLREWREEEGSNNWRVWRERDLFADENAVTGDASSRQFNGESSAADIW